MAVIVAAVAAYLIGWLWYSNKGFGEQWRILTKVTKKRAKKSMNLWTMLLGFIGTIVMALVLMSLIGLTGARSLLDGAFLSTLVWLGFIAPVSLGGVLWEGKPWKLWLLNNAYNIVILVVMGLILTAW